MNSRVKTTVLALSLITVLAAPFAEAARLGKGRSAGMQRSAPTQTFQQQQAVPGKAPTQLAPQQKGSGVGGALVAGAAGAAAGYMLGSALSDGQASAGSQQAPGDSFPWLYVIGGALAGLALLSFFRRRAAKPYGQRAPAPLHSQPMQFQAAGGVPPIGSSQPAFGGSGLTPPPSSLQRLPDGTEVPHFLRQAKATFLHLQSMNSPDSVDEVKKYMTPELFAALRDDIAANTEPADFPQLECVVVDAANEGSRMVASVRFSGTVSEHVGAAPQPFSETWH